MLKPSEALKQSWKDECKTKCSVYWTVTKVAPYGKYRICYKDCYQKKKKYEIYKMNGLQ